MDGFTAAVVAWNELSWHEFFWGRTMELGRRTFTGCQAILTRWRIFVTLEWRGIWYQMIKFINSSYYDVSFGRTLADVRPSFSRFRFAWLATESGNHCPGEAPEFWPVAGEGSRMRKEIQGVDFEGNKKLRNWNEHKNGGRSYLWTCQTRANHSYRPSGYRFRAQQIQLGDPQWVFVLFRTCR